MSGNELAVFVASVAGIVLSLIFSYVPGLHPKYDALDSTWKSLIMLVLLVLVSVGVYLVSCAGWWILVPCEKQGIIQLATAFIAALVANQATYKISPQLKS